MKRRDIMPKVKVAICPVLQTARDKEDGGHEFWGEWSRRHAVLTST